MKNFLRSPAPLSTSVCPLTVVLSSIVTPATVAARTGTATARNISAALSLERIGGPPRLKSIRGIVAEWRTDTPVCPPTPFKEKRGQTRVSVLHILIARSTQNHRRRMTSHTASLPRRRDKPEWSDLCTRED